MADERPTETQNNSDVGAGNINHDLSSNSTSVAASSWRIGNTDANANSDLNCNSMNSTVHNATTVGDIRDEINPVTAESEVMVEGNSFQENSIALKDKPSLVIDFELPSDQNVVISETSEGLSLTEENGIAFVSESPSDQSIVEYDDLVSVNLNSGSTSSLSGLEILSASAISVKKSATSRIIADPVIEPVTSISNEGLTESGTLATKAVEAVTVTSVSENVSTSTTYSAVSEIADESVIQMATSISNENIADSVLYAQCSETVAETTIVSCVLEMVPTSASSNTESITSDIAENQLIQSTAPIRVKTLTTSVSDTLIPEVTAALATSNVSENVPTSVTATTVSTISKIIENHSVQPGTAISTESLASVDSIGLPQEGTGHPTEVLELRELVQHLQKMLNTQLGEREKLQAANERLGRELASVTGAETGARKSLTAAGKPLDSKKTAATADGVSVMIADGKATPSGDLDMIGKMAMLEGTIKKQRKELDAASVTISNLQSTVKKEKASLQAEAQTKLNMLKKSLEDLQREKETMVVRYAQAEQRNLELSERASRSEGKLNSWAKEREIAVQKFNKMRADALKAAQLLESKDGEIATLKKEVEYHKDLSASGDVQAKFHHGRLKDEQEAQRELKARLDEMMVKVTENSADWDLIRDEFSLLRKSQQVGHNVVTMAALQKVKTRLEVALQPSASNRDQVVTLALKELLACVDTEIQLLEILNSKSDKLDQSEREMVDLLEVKVKLDEKVKNLEQDLENNKEELNKLCDVKSTVAILEAKISELTERNKELEQTEEDMQADRHTYKLREEENLEFTQRITNKNSLLQSDNITLRAELKDQKERADDLASKCSELEISVKDLTNRLTTLEQSSSEQVASLTTQLKEQTTLAVEYKVKVADMEDELKTVKRQHASIVKDLTRQLQAINKRGEADRDADSDKRSLGRIDSDSSIDSANGMIVGMANCRRESGSANGVTVGGANTRRESGSANGISVEIGSSRRPITVGQEESDLDCPTVKVVEIDRQRLLDKIISLQKSHARKTEKIDFLEDHVRHLSEDVLRKSRILQSYIQREETGVLSSEDSDRAKAQISSRGGIMASLYSTHSQDGAMTVDLALQISHKLQNVLEDSLLKNIMLKENMETLGHQVAILSEQKLKLEQQLTGLSNELRQLRQKDRSKASTTSPS